MGERTGGIQGIQNYFQLLWFDAMVIERNTEFLSEISENKGQIVFPSKLTNPKLRAPDDFGTPQVILEVSVSSDIDERTCP